MFQSLFFWIMPTGYSSILATAILFWVSILVLLDNAYRRLTSQGHRGSGRVSILVLLDNAYRLFKPEAINYALGFQSLFFWIMPTGL